MKRFFILFSIMVVGMLAFVDAKTRMDELDDVAATTPGQVEMKREIPQSTGSGIQEQTDNSPSKLAFPKSPNNNAEFQNIPQKLNPEFTDKIQPAIPQINHNP